MTQEKAVILDAEDDDEDDVATAPEAPPEPDELDDNEPPEPAAQLPEDRLGEVTLIVEATYDHLVGPFSAVAAGRNVAETLYFMLALADRLMVRAGAIFGDGIELSDRAYRLLTAVAERIEKGKFDARVDWPVEVAAREIGFGAWEPPPAG